MSTQESDQANTQELAPVAPVVGLIGTFMLCAAVMMAHLTPPEVKPVAVGLWICALLLQAGAFGLACANRWPARRR
jgi:glycerol uptake facilitator-like aquaporin